MSPCVVLVPTVRPVLPVRSAPAKVGVLVAAMSWMVLTVPPVAVKLVLLKTAIPFWLVVAVVVASFMVMVLPAAVALLSARMPTMPLSDDTPPPVPVPLRQLENARTPVPVVLRHCPDAPSATGRVKVRLLVVAPAWSVRVLLLVVLAKVSTPAVPDGVPVPRVSDAVPLAPWIIPLPAIVTVVPLSLTMESTRVLGPLKRASAPVVPPGAVTVPPRPTQLPVVVQIL